MAFDYKKEYKEFHLPPRRPQIVEVPEMHFVAVRGSGNPNEEGGEYKTAMQLLYGLAFTIKMSKMGDHRIEGYFDYVVPPLEGLWWQDGESDLDLSRKESFRWISMIRLPEFVTKVGLLLIDLQQILPEDLLCQIALDGFVHLILAMRIDDIVERSTGKVTK